MNVIFIRFNCIFAIEYTAASAKTEGKTFVRRDPPKNYIVHLKSSPYFHSANIGIRTHPSMTNTL